MLSSSHLQGGLIHVYPISQAIFNTIASVVIGNLLEGCFNSELLIHKIRKNGGYPYCLIKMMGFCHNLVVCV